MPNTRRLQWPYPSDAQEPWFDAFESMVTAQDSTGYANREDRQLILSKGGTWLWNSLTGELSWDEDLEILSPISGFKLVVAAGSVVLEEGEAAYVNVVRAPSASTAVAMTVASTVPNTDDAFAIVVRSNDEVYFRTGVRLANGDSVNLFTAIGAVAVTDVYERVATFTVAEGSATDEATLGSIVYAGSLIGVGAELTRAVVSGSVTINVQVNGVTKLTAVLNASTPTVTRDVAAGGTYPLMQDDIVSVEVVSSSYDNIDDLSAGLTVAVAMLSGVNVEPGDIPDADSLTKGVVKLSVDPVVASSPIAYGANDPVVARLDTFQVYSKAQGTDLVALTDSATIATDCSLGNSFAVVLGGNRMLGNPTNLSAGFTYTWKIEQDGGGGRTLAYDSKFKFAGGVTPTITATGGAIDIIVGFTDGVDIYCSIIQDMS